jgi:hypothetical protein
LRGACQFRLRENAGVCSTFHDARRIRLLLTGIIAVRPADQAYESDATAWFV